MSKKYSLFELEGTFLAFVETRDSLPRRMLLDCQGDHRTLKIGKNLRGSIGRQLTPGAQLRVMGEQKLDKDSGLLKQKAILIEVLGHSRVPARQTSFGCIQVCTKSNCWKNGGKQLWKNLEAALEFHGLQDQVQLVETGCLKNCKNSPSCCFQPSGTTFGGESADRIECIVETQFGNGEPERHG